MLPPHLHLRGAPRFIGEGDRRPGAAWDILHPSRFDKSPYRYYTCVHETDCTHQTATDARTTGRPEADAFSSQRCVQLCRRTGLATEGFRPVRLAETFLRRCACPV